MAVNTATVLDAALKPSARRLKLELLDSGERQIVEDAALHLLSRTGLAVECPEAAGRLQAAGARVERQEGKFRVKLPDHLVMESLAAAPKNIIWPGQRPEWDYDPARSDSDMLVYGIHVRMIDPETRELRASTKRDCDDVSRLFNLLPNIPVQLEAVAATDYPARAMSAAQVHAMLSHCGKFMFTASASQEENRTILKMLHAVAGGEENFRKRPFLCLTGAPISPLVLDKECTDTLTFTAEAGFISHAVTMCLAGATGPVTLQGSVVLTVAELLAALVYVQAVKKGAPMSLSTCSTGLDMKNGAAASGSPDTSAICGPVAQMFGHYGIQGFYSSGVSESKIPDPQSAYEFAVNVSFLAAAGAPIICGAGSLEGGLTFDYAKLLQDDECFTNIKKSMGGLSWDRDQLALDIIDQVGPGGNFLRHRSTVKNFRTCLSPSRLFDRTNRGAWQSAGAASSLDRAYDLARELLRTETAFSLPKSIQAEIDDLLAEHAARCQ